MKRINLGVIGYGLRASIAIAAHNPDNNVHVSAIAEKDPQILERFRQGGKEWERFGKQDIFLTDNYHDILKRDDIDAVLILTPDYMHTEHTIDCLKAGKAVYLEKPMATTIEGCDRILDTYYQTGTKLFVGHNFRQFPIMQKMKEVVDSGVVGNIQAIWCRHFINYGGDAFFKDWHSERKNTTGLLIQKASHDFDIIHWLTGSFTKHVVAMGKLSVYDRCAKRSESDKPDFSTFGSSSNWPPLEVKGFSPKIDIEDHSMVLLELQNGVQASYMQCHYTPDGGRNYTIIGEHGRIENVGDFGDCQLHVYTDRQSEPGKPNTIHFVKDAPGTHAGADPKIFAEFIDWIREDKKPSCDPIAARQAVATGVAATQSMRGGLMPLTIPEVQGDFIPGNKRNE